MDPTADIFSSPAAFELYCADVESRIAAARSNRAEFLRAAIVRLEALHQKAMALGSTDVSEGLAEKLERANAELMTLSVN